MGFEPTISAGERPQTYALDARPMGRAAVGLVMEINIRKILILVPVQITGNYTNQLVKVKAIPLQAWTGPEGFRRLRLPDFKTIGT